MNNFAGKIPDTDLTTTVREALGLDSSDPILQKELEKLEHLDANNKGISDLTGLEKATGLTTFRTE